MFVGTSSSVLGQIARFWRGVGHAPDPALASALLLNIALVIFGWRRYRELSIEIAVRRKAELHAQALARTDPLTGCLNRRSIGPVATDLIQRAHEGHSWVAFLMVDLDNFKLINDLNGHRIGDEVLIETARRMRAILPRDTATARLGGDEFACVVQYDPQKSDRIDQLAEAVIAAVAQPIDIDGFGVEVTVSVGIAKTAGTATSEDADRESQTVLHRADIAMYHAKKQGRDRHCWYEPSMEEELRVRNDLETGIRRGIPAGEFVPYYEQQVDVESGELVGFEMLARWHSPYLGAVNPDIFIPIAEDIGVISDMSASLLAQAFRDAAEWHPKLTLSVNISPVQLRDPWFAQKLLKQLVESGFPPHRLEIEITESCLHENIGMVRSVVTSLKNQGIKLSLDDFGTGYSSLAQLRQLPFDRLKIDRSFVSELGRTDGHSKLVDGIVALSQGLGLPITAEGIENQTVLDAVRRLGAMKGQGFLYGRPEDAAQTRERLAACGMLAPDLDIAQNLNEPGQNKTRETG